MIYICLRKTEIINSHLIGDKLSEFTDANIYISSIFIKTIQNVNFVCITI